MNSIARLLLKTKAVTFHIKSPLVDTTGIKLPIVINNRIIFSYPQERKKIISKYVQTIKKYIGIKDIDYISGTAISAIPQASWIADRLNLPMVYVRPKRDEKVKKRKVEGNFPKGSRIVIVEDHVTTAESLLYSVKAIRELGGKVTYAIATTSYLLPKTQGKLRENKIILFPLLSYTDLIQEAFNTDLISEEEKEILFQWYKNPEGWRQ